MTLGQNSPGRDLKNRYLVFGSLMLLGILVLAVRTYRLQVTRFDEFEQKSQANFVKEVRLRADRGMVLDASGEILADNRPSFDLFVTPAFCQKCADETLPRLVALLGWDSIAQSQLIDQLRALKKSAGFQPARLRVDLSQEEVALIAAHHLELPGIDVEPVAHREYLMAPQRSYEGKTTNAATYLSHVLGYMNEITQEELDRMVARGDTTYRLGDYIGRRGLERFYEAKLRGVDGWQKEVVNARGETLPELSRLLREQEQRHEPKPGSNVQLSIDMRLEEEAEKVFPGRAGAVVMVEVNTGFIITMLSRPGYDSNMMSGRVSPEQMGVLFKDPLQPMVFRPVAQHYSPGSTFKVVTALAALRSGQFTAQSTVSCNGGYSLGKRRWRCHKDSGHGTVYSKTALQESCDTYFYRVADVLGLDPIAKVGAELGLGQLTGIGVVAEVPGIMPTEAYHERAQVGGYQKGMALNEAIGQGDDNVTPLQLAMVYSAIANGGTLYQPQLVRRLISAEGNVVEQPQPKVVRQMQIDPEHHRVLTEALVAVVNEPGGTAYRSRLPDVVIAGKTGTAQVVRLGAVRLKLEQMDYFERDHAWFAGFAPADNPEVAVVVLNEHGGHGGSASAPTAAALIKKYFELKKQDAVAAAEVAKAKEGALTATDATSTVKPASAAEAPPLPPANNGVVPAAAKPAPSPAGEAAQPAPAGASVIPAVVKPEPAQPVPSPAPAVVKPASLPEAAVPPRPPGASAAAPSPPPPAATASAPAVAPAAPPSSTPVVPPATEPQKPPGAEH